MRRKGLTTAVGLLLSLLLTTALPATALLTTAYAQPSVLFDAVRLGGVPEVRAALEEENDLNVRNAEGFTPLLIAARVNTPDVMRVLLGAADNLDDVVLRNPQTGDTIFALANENPNRTAMYELLAERGVSVRLGNGPRTAATQLSGPPLPSF